MMVGAVLKTGRATATLDTIVSAGPPLQVGVVEAGTKYTPFHGNVKPNPNGRDGDSTPDDLMRKMGETLGSLTDG